MCKLIQDVARDSSVLQVFREIAFQADGEKFQSLRPEPVDGFLQLCSAVSIQAVCDQQQGASLVVSFLRFVEGGENGIV